jgi:putative phosphonate metabolism protein
MPEPGTAANRRYAIYFAPPEDSDLHRSGSDWLGYDAIAGEERTPELPGSISEADWRAATDEPRRYGLHATLKPPFRLARGATEAALIAKLSVFATGRSPVVLPTMKLSRIGRFLALVPGDDCGEMTALAAECVTVFDDFRAPPTEPEIARRRAAHLTPRQEEMLQRWGYPYVLDEFRFHMTLAGPLEDTVAGRIGKTLEDRLAPALTKPLGIGSLCLFVQPTQEGRFRLLRRFVLGGA